MANLWYKDKHNMVAFQKKPNESVGFSEIVDILRGTSLRYALTHNSTIYDSLVKQFWQTATVRTLANGTQELVAYIDNKEYTITEESVRKKTDGNAEFHEIIDFLTRSSIHYALTVSPVVFTTFVEQFWMTAKSKTINNVRYITATVAGKPVSISEASIRNHFPINVLTTKVFSFMVKKGKKFSGNVTPLFPSMLAQPTEDEGAVSKRPSETQPTPSPTHPSEDQSKLTLGPFLRPSSSNPIPDSIPKGSGGNHGGQSSSDRSLSGNEGGTPKCLKNKATPVISHHNAWIKSVSMKKRLVRKKSLKTKLMQKESVSKQGRKPTKSEPIVHKDLAFDDLDDAMDYMEPEDAHDEGTVKDSKETRVCTEEQVSTDKPNEGTAELKDGNSDKSAAPTTIFRDDETMLNFWSIVTLKLLSKIDPKDKGKKVLEEKAKSDAKSKGANEAERKFAQLARNS
ncbi:hypothetical protein Tco_0482216 [Tanacetum coccineum]